MTNGSSELAVEILCRLKQTLLNASLRDSVNDASGRFSHSPIGCGGNARRRRLRADPTTIELCTPPTAGFRFMHCVFAKLQMTCGSAQGCSGTEGCNTRIGYFPVKPVTSLSGQPLGLALRLVSPRAYPARKWRYSFARCHYFSYPETGMTFFVNGHFLRR